MSCDSKSLFLKARSGNIEAYEHLIETYQKKIYALALKVSGNRYNASELAQEVFIQAYKSICSAENEKQFPALIYKTAAGICLDNEKHVRNKVACDYRNMPV